MIVCTSLRYTYSTCVSHKATPLCGASVFSLITSPVRTELMKLHVLRCAPLVLWPHPMQQLQLHISQETPQHKTAQVLSSPGEFIHFTLCTVWWAMLALHGCSRLGALHSTDCVQARREEESGSHVPVLVFYWLLRQPSSTAMKQNTEKVISLNGNQCGNPLNSVRSEKLSGFYVYFTPTKLEKNWYQQLILFPKCIESLRKLNFTFTLQTKILIDIS